MVLCVVGILLLTPRKPAWYCMADTFHRLIEPLPPGAMMGVEGEAEEEGAIYRLELRFASVVYGRGASEVPPLSGYLTGPNHYTFMEGIQGDVRCNTLQLPSITMREGMPAVVATGSSTSTLVFKVSKAGRQLRLDYTPTYQAYSGVTYSQEFDLPAGVTFVTNLGIHPVQVNWRSPEWLPEFLNINRWFGWQETMQMEHFVMLRYTRLEKGELSEAEPTLPEALPVSDR
jgi:hypothetical protein